MLVDMSSPRRGVGPVLRVRLLGCLRGRTVSAWRRSVLRAGSTAV